MQKLSGWAEQGGVIVRQAGPPPPPPPPGPLIAPPTKVQASFPGATVTVYFASPAAGVAIAAISRTANVVTVTIPAGSGFLSGQPVTIAGVTDASFNGTFTIQVTTGTSFTYNQTAANASSSGGTAQSNLRLATIYADNQGTAKANPFTAAADGTWLSWVANGLYDVQFSGAGIPAPFTLTGLGTAGISGLLGPAYLSACDFMGADASYKIAAAIATLPTIGGTVDARCLTGAQTLSVNVFAGQNKPVQLLLGFANYTVMAKQVLWVSGSSIEGVGAFHGNGTVLTAGAALDAVIEVSDAGSHAYPENMTVSRLYVDGNSQAARGFKIWNTHLSRYIDLHARNCALVGFDFEDELYDIYTENLQATSNNRGIQVVSPNGANSDKIQFVNPRCYGNTNEGLLLSGVGPASSENVVILGGEFENNLTVGIGITSMRCVSIYTAHFEQNSITDIDIYPPSLSSGIGLEVGRIDGCYTHGNNVGQMAIRAKSAILLSITNLYADTHTATGTTGQPSIIDFDNSALTGALQNYGNILLSPVLNEGGGLLNILSHRDGLNVINTTSLGVTGQPSYLFFDQDIMLNAAMQTAANFSQTRALTFTNEPPAGGTSPSIRAQLLARRTTSSTSAPTALELWSTSATGVFNRDLIAQGLQVMIAQGLAINSQQTAPSATLDLYADTTNLISIHRTQAPTAGHLSETFVAAVQTTGNVAQALWTFPLDDQNAFCVTAWVAARDVSAGNRDMAIVSCGAFREGGGATVQSTATQLAPKNFAVVGFAASGNNLVLNVTGIAAQTVAWMMEAKVVRLSN